DSVQLRSPDDDASDLGSRANTFMKGSLSIGAKRLSSMRVDSATMPKMTVNDLEKVHHDQW
ncbi:hypothetical protein Tco_1340686, partial [Tanacetum coccineum]